MAYAASAEATSERLVEPIATPSSLPRTIRLKQQSPGIFERRVLQQERVEVLGVDQLCIGLKAVLAIFRERERDVHVVAHGHESA